VKAEKINDLKALIVIVKFEDLIFSGPNNF